MLAIGRTVRAIIGGTRYRLIVDDYNESTGNAEVVFKSKADAMDAIDRCKTNFYDFFHCCKHFYYRLSKPNLRWLGVQT